MHRAQRPPAERLSTPGVALPPEDFPDRPTALREMNGLPWEGMACSLGVDPRRLQQWRRGRWPNGGAMLAPVDLATRAPDGLGKLLDRGLVVVRRGGR